MITIEYLKELEESMESKNDPKLKKLFNLIYELIEENKKLKNINLAEIE